MGRYDDIIERKHPTSKVHPRMSAADRAAQFSAFAALNGYEDAIDETKRLTDTFMELDEGEQERINEQLILLQESCQEHPLVTVTFFEPDFRKEGGEYRTVCAKVKKLDEYQKKLLLEGELEIQMEFIREIRVERQASKTED